MVTYTYDSLTDLMKGVWEPIPPQPNMTYDTGPVADEPIVVEEPAVDSPPSEGN